MAKAIGRFIVVDPNVCHGQPTFRGTRILVADILDQVANGILRDEDQSTSDFIGHCKRRPIPGAYC